MITKEMDERRTIPPLSVDDEARIRQLAKSKERLKLSVMNDFAFKTVFGNTKVVKGLLSAALGIPVDEITEIEFPVTFVQGEYPEEKTGILDIRVHLNGDQKINIEMQVLPFPYWEERSLYYLCKMYVEGLKRGMDYGVLEKCVQISILKYSLLDREQFYSEIEFMDRKTGRLYSDKISLRVLQLNQLEKAAEEEKQSDLYLWAKMISADDWEVLEMLAKENEYMGEAVRELEKINSDPEKRYEYLYREMRELDENTIRNYFTDKGRMEGRAEDILDILEELGEIPESVRARICGEKDMAVLKTWLICASKAESFQEFLEKA